MYCWHLLGFGFIINKFQSICVTHHANLIISTLWLMDMENNHDVLTIQPVHVCVADDSLHIKNETRTMNKDYQYESDRGSVEKQYCCWDAYCKMCDSCFDRCCEGCLNILCCKQCSKSQMWYSTVLLYVLCILSFVLCRCNLEAAHRA